MSAAERVLARRRAERERLLRLARDYVAVLEERLGLVGAVVVGSVARGDFNRWSDVDLLLVVRDDLPERAVDRLSLLLDRPPEVQPFLWTLAEWHAGIQRRNPVAVEAAERGVWLSGEDEVRAGTDARL